ncbi:hypothetical protein [Kushneria indalinina]|uniref:CDP-glycerol:poly(Glycerophosphate) glycerophosphotransferase n=1 Tax=Kushneria indalinina DSM 14324 TaxID=1122140 RepID=A0A3D9DU52_9GAMM|nr:hypothetical protein [Kushneria indalinina]REC94286.1 hypothetical protein C8D72_2657 [Kushneria indalinina DSM 14324]
MKIKNMLSLALKALSQEPEVYIAYLFGNKTHELSFLNKKKKMYTGKLQRIIIFFWIALRRFSLLQKKVKRVDVVYYAETSNQFNSLIPSYNEISKIEKCSFILDKEAAGKKSKVCNSYKLGFDMKHLIGSLYLMLARHSKLDKELNEKNLSKEIKYNLDKFYVPYPYLLFFLSFLKNAQPRVVVVSNDHNPTNRSLKLAAEVLKIKTAYMQHASVSNLFPPLEFDYAFLDGVISLNEYVECQNKAKRIRKSKSRVYLCGQQKKVLKNNSSIKKRGVGIGVNKLDDVKKVISLIERLNRLDCKVYVRVHPYQGKEFLNSISNRFRNNESVEIINPRDISLSDFFGFCSVLIAADTSLHLEAALAGIETYYYNMGGEKTDYYGFVRNGVSNYLPKDLKTIEISKNDEKGKRETAIRKYSESYKTSWQDKEGCLVASILKDIVNETDCSDRFFYRLEPSFCFDKVFLLNHKGSNDVDLQ